MVKYWLCITNEENWRVVCERLVWGVPERRRAVMGRVGVGDLLVFYVKPKRIGGIFRAVSKPFRSEEELFSWAEYGKHELFPYRVMLEPVIVPEEPVRFEPLVERLSFTRGRARWSTPFRRGMFVISQEDYEVIKAYIGKGDG